MVCVNLRTLTLFYVAPEYLSYMILNSRIKKMYLKTYGSIIVS